MISRFIVFVFCLSFVTAVSAENAPIQLMLAVEWEIVPVYADQLNELSFEWSIPENFPSERNDCEISVQLIDRNGERRFEVKHSPPLPFSEWMHAQIYKYSLPIWVSKDVPEGIYEVTVGLTERYSNSPMHILQNGSVTDRLKTGRIRLINKSIPGEFSTTPAEYKAGFYSPEIDTERNLPFHWMGSYALAAIPNPYSDARIYIEISRPLPEQHNEFFIRINGILIEKTTLTSVPNRYCFRLPRAFFENLKECTIEFIADKAISPASFGESDDTRSLSARIYYLVCVAGN